MQLQGKRFSPVEAETAGAFRNISGLVETSNGDLWILGGVGLLRVPATEVAMATADPGHHVSAQIFDARAGLRGVSAEIRPVPTLMESSSGHLVARTSQGLYSINTSDVSRGPLPPAITLRSLRADGYEYPVATAVDLPAHTSAMSIRYSGLSLSAAEQVHYRYRLDGFDHDWQEVQGRQEAFYTNLPPGQYRFHVQAGLTGDPWNPAEASMTLRIEPSFTQTSAFLVLCAVLTAIAVYLVVQWRVRSASRRVETRERERMTARMGERERIAREIHATLLQSAQAVVMMIGAASSSLRKGKPATELLDSAAASGEQAIVEARARIYELRRQEGSSIDVGNELRSLG